MKYCNSAFTTQGLRVIIIVVQVGAMKALTENERGDES
jgi:hypothetical protein